MHEVLSGLDAVAVAVLRCSAQATVLIPVLLGIRYLFGRHLRAAGRWWLWWIVAGRLLLPWSPGAPFSLYGILEIRHRSASRVGTADGSERGSDRMGDLGPKPSPSSLGANRQARHRFGGANLRTVLGPALDLEHPAPRRSALGAGVCGRPWSDRYGRIPDESPGSDSDHGTWDETVGPAG